MDVVKLLLDLANKIANRQISVADTVAEVLDLANKIASGQISVDDAVAEVHSQRIKAMFDEETVAELNTLANSLTNQSPSLAYYLAYLTYEAAKIVNDRFLQGYSAVKLADLSFRMARYPQAIKLYQEALTALEELNNKQVIGPILGNMGNAYFSLSQFQKAIDYYEKALKIAKETGDRKNEGNWLGSLGNAYFSLGQYQKAIDYFEKALKIAQETGNRQGEGNSLGSLGNAYRSLGQYQKAINYYEKGLKIAQEIGDVDGERILNLNLGRVYDDHLSEPEKAYDHYQRSIKLSELIRGGLIEESHKIGFSGRIESAYYRMVPLCWKLKKDKEAYEYTEKAKSRAFLDLLATTEIKPAVALPIELKEREDECLRVLRQVQRRAFGETDYRPQVDVIKVAEELETIYDQIERYDPEYAFLRRGRPLSLNQIQGLLKTQSKKTVLVEYFVTNERILIFVLRSDDSELHIKEATKDGKPLTSERLWTYVKSYEREIVKYPSSGDTGQSWQELSQYLIEPIAKYLKEDDMLYIVPHGVLHHLPLHALRHNGRYLIEDFEIVYSPSASLIKFCQEKPHHGKERVLVFGNPTLDLKDSEEEAKEVARLFNTKPYIGKEATKVRIKSSSADMDVIHLACHGEFKPDEPMSSCIKLADGELTSQEVFNLRFRANLIVLSACETGISKISSGDELIGLTRAFIYAGTPSFIASLWCVADASTSRLMIDFYKNWKEKGQSKVSALQDAQLNLMKDSRYSHPYYWSPFVLVGDWK